MGYPPLPQNNVVDGMTGHENDHDDIYAGLSALETAVPYPPGGTTNFLRADGTWAAPTGVTLDSTAGDFLGDGTQSAGSSSHAARADHVHPETAWQTIGITPAGGLAETFPRLFAINTQAPASGLAHCQLTYLPKGLVVTNIHTITTSTAESGATNGWVGITDTNFTVLAVSTAQTGNTWGSTNADIPVALSSPYTVPSSGAYYVVVSVTASVIPGLACGSGPINTAAFAITPAITCNRGTQNAPPTVSSTLGSTTTVNSADPIYSYIS